MGKATSSAKWEAQADCSSFCQRHERCSQQVPGMWLLYVHFKACQLCNPEWCDSRLPSELITFSRNTPFCITYLNKALSHYVLVSGFYSAVVYIKGCFYPELFFLFFSCTFFTSTPHSFFFLYTACLYISLLNQLQSVLIAGLAHWT